MVTDEDFVTRTARKLAELYPNRHSGMTGYVNDAIALLQSARDASTAMCEKVECHLLEYSEGGRDSFDYFSAKNAKEVFAAMIDEAIRVTPKETEG